jgi:hypothetical protein
MDDHHFNYIIKLKNKNIGGSVCFRVFVPNLGLKHFEIVLDG